MKRLVSLLVILLSVIFIAHAKSERTDLPAAVVSTSQKEVSAKLNELNTRRATLQTELDLSNALLRKRGQMQ